MNGKPSRRSKPLASTAHRLIEAHEVRGISVDEVLTPRQVEVLLLIADGFSVKEIGEKLGVSFKTIETHRAHVVARLGISTIAGLTRYAIRQRLIKP